VPLNSILCSLSLSLSGVQTSPQKPRQPPEMDSSSLCDENSSSETDLDRSTVIDSTDFSRTISDVSSFSERSEDHSGPYESHSHHRGLWPPPRRPSPSLNRMSMKQRSSDVFNKRSPADDGMLTLLF
jgi:hypothetical protein